jgi:hypothetical protein
MELDYNVNVILVLLSVVSLVVLLKGPHVTMKVPDRVVQEDAETGKKCPGG